MPRFRFRAHFDVIASILMCVGALCALLAILRRDKVSLGIPLAYLGGLLIIHVPGAFAHLVGRRSLSDDDAVALGIRYAAIGAAFFVAGVWLARWSGRRKPRYRASVGTTRFALFCLFGGWALVYGLGVSPLGRIPSVGAVIDKAGSIWILGVLLGLRGSFESRNPRALVAWTGALLVYPVTTLILGGFLSYGVASITVVSAALAISTKYYARAFVGIAISVLIGTNLFVNYFEHRADIRDQVWGRASLEERLGSIATMFSEFHAFSVDSGDDLDALDARLNQNFFVGLSARRIQARQSEFLYGRSVSDGLLALVPRAMWPDKPVFAGSGHIVADATGLRLSQGTSWGVGNVMEFYINFGLWGLAIGFLLLGYILGRLDLSAAVAVSCNDFGATIMRLLPAVALIQPNGSIVEMASGAAAALIAACFWRVAWTAWRKRHGGQEAHRATPASYGRAAKG